MHVTQDFFKVWNWSLYMDLNVRITRTRVIAYDSNIVQQRQRCIQSMYMYFKIYSDFRVLRS